MGSDELSPNAQLLMMAPTEGKALDSDQGIRVTSPHWTIELDALTGIVIYEPCLLQCAHECQLAELWLYGACSSFMCLRRGMPLHTRCSPTLCQCLLISDECDQ